MIKHIRSQNTNQDPQQDPQGDIMKKTLAVLTILIITCTFSAGAFAGPQKQGKGLRKAGPRACMNLTDEQQKQFRDLYQRYIDDTYEMRSEKMNLDQQIRLYMATSDPAPAKLRSMVMEKADLEKDLDLKRLEFALDAREISPELKFIGMGKGFGSHGMGCDFRGKGFGSGAGFKGPYAAPSENK